MRKAGGELPTSEAITRTIKLSGSAVTAWQAVVTATLGGTGVWSQGGPCTEATSDEEGHST